MKPLVFIFLFLNLSFGEVPCRDVNLSLNPKWGQAAFLLKGKDTRWGHYLRQMPLYDQGKTGICYSYTAVQMVDFWRETMGIKVTKELMLSTPLYAALLSRIHEKSADYGTKTLEGGDIAGNLKSIQALGMCREDIILDSLAKFSYGRNLDPREFLEIVELIFAQFPGDPEIIQNMSEANIWKKYIYNKISFYDGRNINEDGNLAKVLKKAAPYIQNGDLTKFFNDLFFECQKPASIYVGTKRIPPPTEIIARAENLEALKDLIRFQLSKPKAQPIGIGYCSKVLENRNYEGRIPDPDYDNQMVAKNLEECGSHASIIIGMQNIQGKCHYLLRNSWGTRCNYDWQCRFNAKNEAVGILIDEDALIKNIGELAYLKNRDFLCMAKTGLGEEFFDMDLPTYPIDPKNFIYIFGKSELLVIKKTQDGKFEFLFGKDTKSLYKADEIEEKKLKLPIKIGLSIPKRGINLKLACIPNAPNRSVQQNQLRKIISSFN